MKGIPATELDFVMGLSAKSTKTFTESLTTVQRVCQSAGDLSKPELRSQLDSTVALLVQATGLQQGTADKRDLSLVLRTLQILLSQAAPWLLLPVCRENNLAQANLFIYAFL